jgi:6-phosphogluconolactonase (cycloisomerase 2 family)
MLAVLAAACSSGGDGGKKAPSQLTYSDNPATYTQGFAVPPNVPTVKGTVTTWSVAPPLPAGLALDGSGTILGTPLVTLPATDFTVMAMNASGSTQAVVNVAILAPTVRALYVANLTDDTVGSFHVGSLIHSGYALSTGTSPRALAARADGAFVYAANNASSTISAFAADALTGRLAPAGAAVAAGSQPSALATEVTGSFLFAANRGDDSITTFAIDAGAPVAGTTANTGDEPAALVVDPTGAFLYAANFASDDVERFSIDPVTGALVTGGIVVAGDGPMGLAIATTPAGSFLYGANSNDGSISQWSIDPATGALTPLAPATAAAGTDPRAVAAHPDGTFLYVANRGDDTLGMYSIDQATGALTPLGAPTIATGTGPTALAITTDGGSLFTCTEFDREVSEFAVAIDGSLSHVVSVRTRGNPTDLVLGPAEKPFLVESANLYAAAPGNSPPVANVAQFAADAVGFSLTALAPAAVATADTGPRAIALHPGGELLLVSSYTGSNVTLFARALATGLLTQVGTEAVNNTFDVAFEPTGRFAYAVRTGGAGGVQPFSVDLVTPDLAPLTLQAAGTTQWNIAVDPTGQFLYLTDANVGIYMFGISAATGELTANGSIASGGGTFDVIVHPSGRFAYASNATGDSISMYAIDEATGALSALTPPTISTGVGTGPAGMDIAQDGNDLYITFISTNQAAHFTIDQATGLLSFVTAIMTFAQGPQTLALDATDAMLTVGNTASPGVLSLYSRDATTGALTSAGFAATNGGANMVVASYDIQ